MEPCLSHQLAIMDYEEKWIVVACEKCKKAWTFERRFKEASPSPAATALPAPPSSESSSCDCPQCRYRVAHGRTAYPADEQELKR